MAEAPTMAKKTKSVFTWGLICLYIAGGSFLSKKRKCRGKYCPNQKKEIRFLNSALLKTWVDFRRQSAYL
jgi:hypothetical protein